MLRAIINIFRIPELRSRVFFTCTMIAIYRIGFWIPLAGVNQQQMVEAAAKYQALQRLRGRTGRS